jgi:hypothetical protein
MYRRAWRLPATVLVLSTVAVLAATAPATGTGVSHAPAQVTPDDDAPFPCGPVVNRTVSKNIVKEGETFDVRTEYDYKCSGQKQKLNFIFLVENTGFLRGGEPTPKPGPQPAGAQPQVGELLNSVRSALKQFINDVDFENGSAGGLTLYSDDVQVLAPFPQAGKNGQDHLIRQVGVIRLSGAANVSGLVTAIRDQTEVLPERAEGVTNALIIFDAGAPILAAGVRLSDIETSCTVAKTNNIVRVIVSLYGTDSRLARIKNCASRGFVYPSGDPNGKDLLGPDNIMDQIAKQLMSGAKATGSEYADRINRDFFEYVPGSGVVDGRPEEPSVTFGNELQWSFTGDPPTGGRVIEYKVKVIDRVEKGKGLLATLSQLTLVFPGGVPPRTMDIGSPDMCVYTDRDLHYCDNFLTATPTPEVGDTPIPQPTTPVADTATPTATDSATAPPATTEPPTEVPTVASNTPVATDRPIGGNAYLPLAVQGHVLRGP